MALNNVVLLIIRLTRIATLCPYVIADLLVICLTRIATICH
jgi:hypothetical protein